ncbi:catechol 1,2-dioxygenase [Paraburkholderia sp. MMS20-SJTR3]|uniref:Catechol 1,2-dioxygenase n=1 Tax=Paraburkholderia sejongensis TaxID=2886946 RepID=A0ABS8JT55_9BURK|nr:dioxygenase [Paraburkholderia sp. MMS20-SJTR3]MCC8393076.1 catechol 1,2-dioxygenase [Paraburkholderia sp. MMS20-SJTR3]
MVAHGLVGDERSLTDTVIKAFEDTQDPRLKTLMAALVRHAHAFVREVDLSERELEAALDFLVRIGQSTHDSHNEAVLAADVLGISTLVSLRCNPAAQGQTAAALLGPFWRADAPLCEPGADIARAPIDAEPLFVAGRVLDPAGQPLAGALVDVWQASPDGLYENQDDGQPDMNLRGRFVTDDAGRFRFRTVRPRGYPVPTDGPVGELLAAQRRHPYRPAHLHFMVSRDGSKTLITQIFADDAEYLDSDVVFGATGSTVGRLVRHPAEADLPARYTLDYDFVLQAGTRTFPKPPIK